MNSQSTTVATARGLLVKFERGTTVLGLLMASEVIQELECLNCTLQKRIKTVSGMLAAVDCVEKYIEGKQI